MVCIFEPRIVFRSLCRVSIILYALHLVCNQKGVLLSDIMSELYFCFAGSMWNKPLFKAGTIQISKYV